MLTTENQPGVFVVVGGRLQHRLVQTGAMLGDDIALQGGVKEGEHVVIHPDNTSVEGTLVN